MRHNRLHLSLSHKEKQTLGVEVRWTSVMISQPGQTSAQSSGIPHKGRPGLKPLPAQMQQNTKQRRLPTRPNVQLSKHTFLCLVCQDLNGEVETYFFYYCNCGRDKQGKKKKPISRSPGTWGTFLLNQVHLGPSAWQQTLLSAETGYAFN